MRGIYQWLVYYITSHRWIPSPHRMPMIWSIDWDHGDSYLLYHSTNTNQIWNKFSFKKGHLEIPSAKWQSFCSRLSMSTILNSAQPDIQMWIITFSDKFFSRSCISSLRSSCFLSSSSSLDCNKKFIVVFAFIKRLSRSFFTLILIYVVNL